jgi:predicted double-glycine peptidase
MPFRSHESPVATRLAYAAWVTRVRRIPRGAITAPVPRIPQATDYTCGAAVVRSVATYFGARPRSEAAVVRVMRFGRDGSDPAHLVRALRHDGLRYIEQRGMSDATLRAHLAAGRPVILMLQAWGERRRYRHVWSEGHWVVAIGCDREGVYVVDPWLADAPGFVAWPALAERWHDVEGRTRRRVHRFGLVVWGRRVITRARRVTRARAVG